MKASSRTLLNRSLNLTLLLAGAFLFGTGWIMDHRLPRGRAGHDLTLLGLGRHDWGELHAITGYVLVALVFAHLALHTAWLHRIAAARRPWLLAVGLGSAVIIAVLLMVLPVAS